MKTVFILIATLSAALAGQSPLAAIKGTVTLPKAWTVTEQIEEDTVVYQITKPAPQPEAPAPAVILSVTTKVPERAEMKPSQYAMELLGGDDAGANVQKSEDGKFQIFRVEHSVEDDAGALRVVNVAMANDTTGTLYFVTWEAPPDEKEDLTAEREKILASLKFDPAF